MVVTTLPTSTTNMTGFLRLHAWIELLEGVHDGAAVILRIEERGGARGRRALATSLPMRPGCCGVSRLTPERVLRLDVEDVRIWS